MIRIFDITLLLCLSSFVLIDGQHDHKIKVAVYYESLCPDSIAFITKQLHPALQDAEIDKHVNLTLIPYGKSTTKKEGNDYKFDCHHGPDECKGNKIHACALAKIPSSADGKNKVTFNYINCLLAKVEKKDKGETVFPVKVCAEDQKGTVQAADIENCAIATDGGQLLDIQGQKTHNLQDPLKSVPTVVFNDKLDAAVNAEAQKNFIATLCKYIDHDKPAACQKASGADEAKPLGITLLTLFALLRVF